MIDIKIEYEKLKQRVIDGVCSQYKRPEKIIVDGKEVDNPTSKADFCNNIVKSFLKEVVTAYEANKEAEFARLVAINKAKAEVNF